jgi:putative acetyltransferase
VFVLSTQHSALSTQHFAIPARQHQGIGSQLVQTGLSRCRDLGHSVVVVLGNPHYYQHFGFQTASKFDIRAPFLVPDEAFMVLELKLNALIEIRGIVRYPPYFDEV